MNLELSKRFFYTTREVTSDHVQIVIRNPMTDKVLKIVADCHREDLYPNEFDALVQGSLDGFVNPKSFEELFTKEGLMR